MHWTRHSPLVTINLMVSISRALGKRYMLPSYGNLYKKRATQCIMANTQGHKEEIVVTVKVLFLSNKDTCTTKC